MHQIFAIAAVAAVAILVAGLWLCINLQRPGHKSLSARDAYERYERARMPLEIQDAKLIISEKTIYRNGRRPFAAKTDQVFQTKAGWVIPVETKTRRTISPSDLVQISAQAAALNEMRRYKGKVASHGYIRLAPEGRAPFYQRVDLMHPNRVDLLWDRYRALRTGKVKPTVKPHARRCDKCAFRSGCPSRAA